MVALAAGAGQGREGRHPLVEPVERAQRHVLHLAPARGVLGVVEGAGARRLHEARPRDEAHAQRRPAARRRRARRLQGAAEVRRGHQGVLRRAARRRALLGRRHRPARLRHARAGRQGPGTGRRPRGGARQAPVRGEEADLGDRERRRRPARGRLARGHRGDDQARLPRAGVDVQALGRRSARRRRLPVHVPRRPGLPGRPRRRRSHEDLADLRPDQGLGRERAQARRPGPRAAAGVRGLARAPRTGPVSPTPSRIACDCSRVRGRHAGSRRSPYHRAASARRTSISTPAPPAGTSPDRTSRIVAQVWPMSAHQSRAGTATWKTTSSSVVRPPLVTVASRRPSAATMPRPSQAQLPHQVRPPASTRVGGRRGVRRTGGPCGSRRRRRARPRGRRRARRASCGRPRAAVRRSARTSA